eukprot:2428120-Rhodomonas_salina.1
MSVSMSVSMPNSSHPVSLRILSTPLAVSITISLPHNSTTKPPLTQPFPLSQWGVEPRKASEGWGAYRQRVQSSRIWKDPPTDFCVFDLSPEGAAELTGWVDEAEDVVYMSFQSCCTWQVPAWLALDGASQ